MAYCDSCADLKEYAPGFMLNGITNKECNSLQKNEGLNPNLTKLHKNCEDLKDMADCLLGALIEKLPAYDECTLKEFIGELAPNMYNVVYALICSDCGQWERIEELEEILNSLLRQQYRRLDYGVDYECRFFSDYYTDARHIDVSVIETAETLAVQMSGSARRGTRLRHDDLKSVQFRHTLSIEERPRAKVYAINFLGKYAKYNSSDNYDYVNTTNGGSGIWNVYNSSGKAFGGSWNGYISPAIDYKDEDGKVWRAMAQMNSYADGYNSQFSSAPIYPDGIYSEAINHSVEFTLIRRG